MDTTKHIKGFILLEFLLTSVYLWLTLTLESKLPELLQQYILVESQSEIDTFDKTLFSIGTILMIAYVVSLVGILCSKIWAKYLYLSIIVVSLPLALFIGPSIEHAIAATIYDLATIVDGVIVSLFLFTNSKFTKLSNKGY